GVCRSRGEWVEPSGGDRLLEQLDAKAFQLRQETDRIVGLPAGVRVDAERAVEDRADRLERGEAGGSADLDLQCGEAARPARPLGDDRRLVDAEGEVGRRDLARQ